MTKKKLGLGKLTQGELELIGQLRKHPELGDRFQKILEMVGAVGGPLQRADEVESLLVEEMRRLGHTTMSRWAAMAEARLGEELQQRDASAYVGKKKH